MSWRKRDPVFDISQISKLPAVAVHCNDNNCWTITIEKDPNITVEVWIPNGWSGYYTLLGEKPSLEWGAIAKDKISGAKLWENRAEHLDEAEDLEAARQECIELFVRTIASNPIRILEETKTNSGIWRLFAGPESRRRRLQWCHDETWRSVDGELI